MRRVAACVVLVLSGATVVACLDLGGVEDDAEPKPDASTGGQSLGDSSFPDAPLDAVFEAGGARGEGGTAGVSGSDAGSGSQLHVFETAGGTWSSVPLAAVWYGPNAPPPSGIRAVTQLEYFDRLLVVTDDGTLYVRSSGNWLLPQALAQKFPLVDELPDCVFHVPSAPGLPQSETVTFVLSSTGVTYTYGSNDIVTYVTTEPLSDEPPPGPPQATHTIVFNYEIRTPGIYPSPDYYHLFSYLTDGNLYQLDAAGAWQKWPVLDSPFWAGQPNAPDPNGIRAAWFDELYEQAYFVGP